MALRIGLLDDAEADEWSSRPNRFEGLAVALTAEGHTAVLVGGSRTAVATRPGIIHLPDDPPPHPLLTGLNHALETAPLTRSHDLVRRIADSRLDLVIAPLRGGIAHGLLMARSCGEAFAAMRIFLWCEASSRQLYLASDTATDGLRPLVADALERTTLRMADGLIVARADAIADLAPSSPEIPPVIPADLPRSPHLLTPADPRPFVARDVVFVGALDRNSGAVAFIDAVETLERSGRLGAVRVGFIGPRRSHAPGVSDTWLGLRAGDWRFPFFLTQETDPLAAWARVSRLPNALAVISVPDGARLPFTVDGHAPHLALSPAAIRAPDFCDRLAAAIAGAASQSPSPPQATTDLPALITMLAAHPLRAIAGAAPPAGLSVCVLHKDRPHLLLHALASLPARLGPEVPWEIILIDNGSSQPESLALLEQLASERPDIRVIREPTSIVAPQAYRRGVDAARHGTIVFLDDDNAFASNGVVRLSQAVMAGHFDAVVSTLDVFDHAGAAPGPSVGHLTFLGDAGSAGLFFNGFGDTAMAIRRDAFLAIGGFPSVDGASPSFDWVMLAKLRAAGKRIGVLQYPAVRYRRDTARAAGTWQKFDRENARSRVFAAYAGQFDAELVARFAQKRHIDDL